MTSKEKELSAQQSKLFQSTPTFCELKPVLLSERNNYPASALHGQAALMRASAEAQGFVVTRDDPTGWIAIWNGSEKVGSFSGTSNSLNSRRARRACADKHRAKEELRKAGVRVAPSILIKDFADLGTLKNREFPLWVKPGTGAGGAGHRFAKDYTDLVDAAEEILAQGGTALVEQFHEGVDVRAVVTGGRFICAATRINAHVIGDGTRSVTDLVAEKNRYRKRHPHLARFPLKTVTEDIAGAVPRSGEFVLLSSVSNLHDGGDSVDVTDRLSPGMVDYIETAARAVRGGGCLGVDLLTTSFTDEAQASVIEINTGANMLTHHYPVFGTPRHVTDAIVDEMLRRSSRRVQGGRGARYWTWGNLRARLARALHRS